MPASVAMMGMDRSLRNWQKAGKSDNTCKPRTERSYLLKLEKTMFARVMSTNLKKDLIDEAAAEWKTHIAPFKATGMERAYMLVDRASGKYLSITIWETEDAQRANATSPGQISGRSAMTEKYFEEAPTPGGFEIVAVVE